MESLKEKASIAGVIWVIFLASVLAISMGIYAFQIIASTFSLSTAILTFFGAICLMILIFYLIKR